MDTNAATGLYYLTKIGYGAGAAIRKTTTNSSSVTVEKGWDPTTLLASTEEPRQAKVTGRNGELFGSAGDTLDVTFASAETYDCDGNPDFTFEGKRDDLLRNWSFPVEARA